MDLSHGTGRHNAAFAAVTTTQGIVALALLLSFLAVPETGPAALVPAIQPNAAADPEP